MKRALTIFSTDKTFWNSRLTGLLRRGKPRASSGRNFCGKPFSALFLSTIILFTTTACSSVFYHPDHLVYVDTKRMPHVPEDVHFQSQDGTKLHGWYFKSVTSPARGLIVHFHGNAQNLTSHFGFLASAPDHGFDHFIFDYRGYGTSEGQPTPKGLVEDGEAALRWAAARRTPLIVVAQSLGGAVAMKALIDLHGETAIESLVIDSSFLSYRSAARGVMGAHWLTWPIQPLAWAIVDNSEGPGRRVRELAVKRLLVVHGENDQVVPYHLGEQIFEAAGEPKTFWKIPRGVHTDFMFRKSWREKLYAWLSELPERK